MMACLFFTAGAIAYKTGAKTIDDVKGIHKKMPLTTAGFTVGAVSVVGVPPTCGFFSKWYLLLGTIHSGEYHYTAGLLLSSLLCAIVLYRVLQSMYSQNNEISTKNDEAPATMLFPIYVTVFAILIIGFMSGNIISTVIDKTIPIGFR